MKKVIQKGIPLLLFLVVCSAGIAQQAVLINTPANTVITYSNTDSRAFALGGLTTNYANTNWPGTARDSGCIYWGVNDTLFNVINGNNTAPPNGTCAGMSNLILTTNPTYTNLANGQACFMGSTAITFIYGSGYSYNTYGLQVYQYIFIRKKSTGAPIPFTLVDGKLLAKVPDGDFFTQVYLYIYFPYSGFTFTTDGSTLYNQNYYAIDLYNRLHTNPNYSICTSWTGGDFYKIPYNADFLTTDPACYGAETGTINTEVSGGVGPWQYSWNTSNPHSEDQTGVKAGNYTLNISDAAYCIITRDVSIHQPDSIRANITTTDVLCAGQDNGTALVTPAGGTGSLEITWYNGGTSTSLNNLAPGNYGVQIKDENNCKTSDTARITEPSALEYNLTLLNPSCYGKSDGSVKVLPTGGTSPYKFAWSSGDSLDERTSLVAGTYALTLSDAHSCSIEIQTSLTEPETLSAIPDVTGITCHGLEDGKIHLEVAGGTSPYDINWSNGPAGPDVTDLPPGEYTATITDAQLCVLEKTIDVAEPDSLVLNLTRTDVRCAGEANGIITADVEGGTIPYTYNWSNEGTESSISGLAPGMYSLVVKDKNNCEVNASLPVTEPTELELLLSPTSPVCSYGNDGEITAEGSGGTLPYHYLWSTGDTTDLLADLGTGTYSFTLKDDNGCTKAEEIVLTSLSNLAVQTGVSPVSCNGMQDGVASLEISGGLEPYDILWAGGNTSAMRSGLGGGVYPFRVYDDYLCAVRDTVIVDEPAELLATATPVDPSCYQGSNGMVNLAVSGGTEPYSFFWSTNAETPAISGLTAGNYEVTVTDAHECQAVASAQLNDPPADFAGFSVETDNGDATFTNQSSAGSYEWNFGDDQGSMDANPLHVYKSNGTYHVCLTVTTSCVTLESCQDVVIDGITIVKKSANGIRLYPNPVINVVNLSWKGSVVPSYFYIYDALGRMVLSKNIHSGEAIDLDVSGLNQGIYQVKFVFEGYYETIPMIISR
ncbi:MAG: T9SS type A sorting domain-containing protein [Bacteroidales bacterium]